MLLDLKDVAERLGVHYSSARDFVLSGKLQGIRLGGRRKIQVREEDLEAFIEASKLGPLSALLIPEIVEKRPISNGAGKPSNMRPHQWRQGFRAK